MNMENKQICDKIFEVIFEKLELLIEEEIFLKTSYEKLGEFYYNYILSNVDGATMDLINSVVRTLRKKEGYESQDLYYKELTMILGFKCLPITLIDDIRREFDSIFVDEYNSVLGKYETEIADVRQKLFDIKKESEQIKKVRPSYSVMRDISLDENRLYELSDECNIKRTRKEMLEHELGYVQSVINDFCNLNDVENIENIIRKIALRNSKEEKEENRKNNFYIYKNCIETFEDNINREYALFFKVKFYIILEKINKKYHLIAHKKTQEEAIEYYKENINKIPKFDDLYNDKMTDMNKYKETLDDILENYDLLDELENMINSSICLRSRKHILLKSIELFKQAEFEIFNNIIPIQVEGIFADYLRDTTTFLRFSNMNIHENAVLRDKIRILDSTVGNMNPDSMEYFMYYYNNIIRNTVAHGKYYANESEYGDEIFAKELFLDLCCLIHIIIRKSEREKMYRFICEYDKYYEGIFKHKEHPLFEPLFYDIIGKKIIVGYDMIEKYRPMQVVYWIVNPYYEKTYEKMDDKAKLINLRNEFLSKEFWEYVLSRLVEVKKQGYDYLGINREFSSIIKAMFKCDITSETKIILGKINALMKNLIIEEK